MGELGRDADNLGDLVPGRDPVAVVIPMYIVVVVQLLRRISQLKRMLSHSTTQAT